jgi:hypothetical protein
MWPCIQCNLPEGRIGAGAMRDIRNDGTLRILTGRFVQPVTGQTHLLFFAA